jgi:hypothetical protein
VHLVGITVGICYDARTNERQILNVAICVETKCVYNKRGVLSAWLLVHIQGVSVVVSLRR